VEDARVEPTWGALFSLAWPIVLSRSTQVVVGLADVAMVAHLGSNAVAAVGAGALDSFVALILPFGVVFIVQSFASQHTGRGELAAARRYGWYGLGVALAAQVLSGVTVLALPAVFQELPYSAEVGPAIVTYMVWRLASGGAATGIEALNAYFGGIGRTRPGMVANVASMFLNLLFNSFFIWGWFGGPEWGTMGAALASSLAVWVAFLGLFLYFLQEGRGYPRPALSGREFWRMLVFGLPSGLNYFFEFLAYVLFVNVVVAGLGTAPIAAWNSVMNLSSVAFMPTFGLASAGAVLVGQAIGADRRQDVPRIVSRVLWVACGWQGIVGVVYLAIPDVVLAPFARGEGGAEVAAVGVSMLLVSVAWQLFDATATTYAEALRAAGDTQFPMWARLIIAWGVFTPGAWLSTRWLGWGPTAAAGWLVVYLALLAVVCAWRFHGGAWRSIQLVEPDVLG
jgi:multidrug resistance protein, MATE family